MQTSTNRNDDTSGTAVPPQEREEDSGLHDIRSLASSTKMRLSSRKITIPPEVDDDILASSSAGWKAVALPEPARMVSLPELETLPAASERAEKSERKSKKELKAERISAKEIAVAAAAVETAPVAAPKVSESTATPVIGARFAQPKKSSKTGLYAALGMGLAAAAGVGWYVSTQMASKDSAPEQVSMAAPQAAPVAAPTPAPAAGSAAVVTPIEEKVEEKPAEPVAADTTVAAAAALDEEKEPARADKRAKAKGGKKDDKVVIDLNSGPKRLETIKEKEKDKPAAPDPKTTGEGDGEPSFDALLKEAGVSDVKKAAKPKLEKKSLSSSDIKTGMSSVAGKAQACYNGTQGTAQVKLTVAPDGTVQKAAVTGVFAGTPVAACVEAAVKGAKFPAWDGGPQSFGFSYLLAE